jgi:hypothetical protein
MTYNITSITTLTVTITDVWHTISLVSRHTSVILYVETFKTVVIVLISNIIMCLTSNRVIIFSIRVSYFMLRILLNETEGEMFKLLKYHNSSCQNHWRTTYNITSITTLPVRITDVWHTISLVSQLFLPESLCDTSDIVCHTSVILAGRVEILVILYVVCQWFWQEELHTISLVSQLFLPESLT